MKKMHRGPTCAGDRGDAGDPGGDTRLRAEFFAKFKVRRTSSFDCPKFKVRLSDV